MRRLTAIACALALLAPGGASAAEPRTPRTPETPLSARLRTATPDRPRTPANTPERPRAVESAPDPAPSVAPTPVPTPEPAPSRSVADRIAAAWPGNDRHALAVVRCETAGTFSPTIYNRQGSGASGLFQFMPGTYRSVGGTPPAANDSIEEQTRRAWDLRQRRGWAPWRASAHCHGLY